MIKFLLCLLFVNVNTTQMSKESAVAAMVHKTLVATAHKCMEVVNATETDLEDLRKDPPFPEKAACIITCLLEKVGIVENKKFSKNGFMLTVTPLIFYNKNKLEHMRTVSENCEKEIKPNQDYCQVGNDITICVFKYAPELHFKS